MASTLLSPTLADYASHAHLDTLGKSGKDYQGSGYISTLSNIVDAVSSSRRESFVQPVDSVDAVNEEEVLENQDLKLPSRASLFVIIGGNALFQVQSFTWINSRQIDIDACWNSFPSSSLFPQPVFMQII